MDMWSIAGRGHLSGTDRSQVDRLRRACEAAEPLDLKLELDETDHHDRPIHFLAIAGDEVIGYAGLTPGDDAEVCGMVHPSCRGSGIGSALLGGIRSAAVSLERDSVLVICEDAAQLAIAWMRRLGATLELTEDRMLVRLRSDDAQVTTGTPLTVRAATDADHATVVELLGEEFSDSADEQRVLGIDAADVVGTMRLIESTQRTMIYGFVIDEQRRGRRLGTRMLATVMARLRGDGVTDVGLEVNTENTPAVRLYKRFGFATVTTYRYMRLPVTQPAPQDPDQAPARRGEAR